MSDQTSNPGQLLEISGAYWESCALHAAIKLGVFTIIGPDQLTAKEIAQTLNGDERGVATLLNALTAMKLLIKSNNGYANAPLSATYLTKDSPQYIGYMIMHHYHLMESWHQLDRAVMKGAPVRLRAAASTEEQRESFLMGMFNMAMTLAPQATKEMNLAGREHLLDLGGGPGTWAIHFCLNNPGMRATIYDLPATRPFAEKIIARFRVSNRVQFQVGNYLEDQIEGKYDVAWLSHILHGESPGDCQIIIDKAVGTLKPGGLIVVHDFILNNDLAGPLFPALFSLNMLTGTKGGRSYSEEQIMDMLAKAGAKNLSRHPFRATNDSGIVVGII
ncbi:MAG: methyltransferase domain-containing protein [Deltaproteobacteria bacterium]|nr:MAG: methyltransferase domain-containing protein [Deltaproteobacteria bacterium]